jgi:putative ABC transport system permease protein
VVIAFWLAYYAAAAGAADERRDGGLLRTRGASRADVMGAAVTQGLSLGLIAALLGFLLALLAIRATGLVDAGAANPAAIAALLLLVGLAAGVMARAAIVMRADRAVVSAARARVGRSGRPLWARLYLDVLALILSAAVFAIDRATGLSAIVNPDTNPTLALSLYSFLAPALLWIGITLLLVRLGSTVLARVAKRLPPADRPRRLLPFLVQSAGRRSTAISRAAILVGLLLSFGVSLGLFSATYDQQALADARLTLGADVVANAPPNGYLSAAVQQSASSVSGVRATSAMQHTFAYVGPDLQDLYGINAATLPAATQLRDSYFTGGSAATILARLRRTPDALLVSAETIKDYGLNQGDLIRLRLLDARTSAYRIVNFHVAGIVTEFPTAPKDSFLVANLDYVTAQTHTAGPNVLLAAADGAPPAVAAAVRQRVSSSGATVHDLSSAVAATSSSLTAISLAGISRLEETFAVGLALAAVVLFGLLAVIERRREFAIMAAMGARMRTVASFLWAETAVVTAVGAVLAVALGTALSLMLVAILTHIFDPPPDALAVPWRFVSALALAVVTGAILSAVLGLVALRRADLSSALRES